MNQLELLTAMVSSLFNGHIRLLMKVENISREQAIKQTIDAMLFDHQSPELQDFLKAALQKMSEDSPSGH